MMYADGKEMSEDEYQAKSDCETLVSAACIKQDKTRYAKAMEYAKKKYEALTSVIQDKKNSGKSKY